MGSSTAEIEALRAAYCPPLDEALFYAIASEYDLATSRDQLAAVLDSLKSGALEQDAADFDPSGTGGPNSRKDYTDTSRSGRDDSLSNGLTSITTGLSELLWTESDSLGHDLDNASADVKAAWLRNIFPDIKKGDLIDVIESHQGSLDKATDELLNLSFLNHGNEDEFFEESPVPKGVDAFAEGFAGPRKSRKKKRSKTTDSSRASSASSYVPEVETDDRNVWATMSEDVEFICSRTSLQPQMVRSVYHANGARLSRTIQALAKKEGALYKPSDENEHVLDLQISEFSMDFESVPKEHLIGLLGLSRNIPSAARELLEAMMTVSSPQEHAKLTIDNPYARIKLEDENTPPFVPSSTWTSIKSAHDRETAAKYRAAASQSFGQASAAYKKGKSDRLMGGAAAYYSQVAHDRLRAAKELHAVEADAFVSGQSSPTYLDLHGVNVADAVRIASSKTQGWWDGLGDAKYAPGGGGPARAGYKIVTGVGSHSKNHAPKIGPAVSKMLIREGWKVEVGHGELIVTGKARRV